MELQDNVQQIHVQIVGDHGLVWSVPDILKLRKEHRLVGCMVGGIAGFKTQVSVGGLPLKLSPEEVTVALQAGWVQLHQTCFCLTIATTVPQQQQQQQQQQAAAVEQPCTAPHNVQQQQEAEPDTALRDAERYDEYYAAYYGLPPLTQAHRRQQQQIEQQWRQQQQRRQKQQRQGPVPAWQAAVASGACFELPMTVHQAAAAAAALPVTGDADSTDSSRGHGGSSSSSTAGSIELTTLQRVQWSFPRTQQQQLRMAVFAYLHSRGYFLTSGSKFGGDFLAYPGDPNLYHAQFVVRVLPLGQVLNPVLFKGLARGVHAARKHLLLASVVQGSCDGAGFGGSEEPQQQRQQQQQQQPQGFQGHVAAAGAKVVCITVAKEDGFGASK